MKLNFKATIKMKDKDVPTVAEHLDDVFGGPSDWPDPFKGIYDEKGRLWSLDDYLSDYRVEVDENGKETRKDEIFTTILRTPVLDKDDAELFLKVLKEFVKAGFFEEAQLKTHLWAKAHGVKSKTDFDTDFGNWGADFPEDYLEQAIAKAKNDLAEELFK